MSEEKNGVGWTDLLSEELETKEAIINAISDALMLIDMETYEILAVNQAFLDFYRVDRKRVIGKKCYEVTHQLDRACHLSEIHSSCPLEESRQGRFSRSEHVHHDRNGRTLYFEISAYPVKDHRGDVRRIVHISRNITEKKQLEIESREKEKLKAVLEIAGAASHEINQPLTVIISGLEQLLKKVEPGGEEQELVRVILDHARRLWDVSRKLGGITHYASKEYLSESRIFDLDRASTGEIDPRKEGDG